MALALRGAALTLIMSALAGGAARADVPQPPGAVDNRGYELVSQADKNGNSVLDAVLSDDGNRVLYNIFGGAPGTSTGARAKLLATRTPGGWVSSNPMPSRDEMLGDSYVVVTARPDLSSWIASAQDTLGKAEYSSDVSLLRVSDVGAQTLLRTFPVFFGAQGVEGVASQDLSRVYATVPEQIDPSHQPGTFNLYELGSGVPQLASRMPGTGLAPRCGVPAGAVVNPSFAYFFSSTSLHWVSDDGSRVVFMTRGDSASCSGPWQLYMRELGAGAATLLSGPTTGRGPDLGADRLLRAASDGTWVLFRTATSFDPADDDDGDSADADVYRWVDGAGLTCETCVVSQAHVLTGADDRAAVSEDGSRVYFESAERLADAPAPGTVSEPNIYVLHAGAVRFVARTDGGVTALPLFNGALTPDGEVLIFASAHPSLNTPSADNGGTIQYYRYDDADESVTCVSCPPGGVPATRPVPDRLVTTRVTVAPDLRALTDDGEKVFFGSDEALVPEDVNDGRDVYEWHAGVVSLITDGLTPRAVIARPQVVTISPDGRDVLFLDTTRLTPDARDGSAKLYDARVNGGFEPPPPPPPDCEGDACLPAVTAPPALVGPSSLSQRSDGNATQSREPRLAVRRLTRVQRVRLARRGRAKVVVRVTGAGRVSLRGQAKVGRRIRTVARSHRRAADAATIRMPLVLSKRARRQLAARGRLKVVLVVRLSSSGATPKRLVVFLRSGR